MTGKPTMSPESESEAGTDILAGGTQPRIGGTGTGIVATVTPGSSGGTTSGAENTAPATEGSDPNPGKQPDPNTPPAGPNENDSKATAPAGDPVNGATAGSAAGGPEKKEAAAGAGQPRGHAQPHSPPRPARAQNRAKAAPKTTHSRNSPEYVGPAREH